MSSLNVLRDHISEFYALKDAESQKKFIRLVQDAYEYGHYIGMCKGIKEAEKVATDTILNLRIHKQTYVNPYPDLPTIPFENLISKNISFEIWKLLAAMPENRIDQNVREKIVRGIYP